MSNQYPPPGYGGDQDPNNSGEPNYGGAPPPPPPPGYGGAPQPNYGGGPGGGKPDTNLVWGILVTLLCCLPLGIVSIIKAAKVDSLWNQGDVAGAQAASEDAKKWAIYGAVAGVVVIILYIVVIVAVGAAGM